MNTPHAPASKPLILIVDDNILNIQLLEDMLIHCGYAVTGAPDGSTGLMIARNKKPDLILLDIMMPGMDGYEVCHQLKTDETTAAIPVIFLTSLDDMGNKLKGFHTGGVDFITKPFQPEDVSVRIETHLKLRNLQLQLEEKNERLQEKIAEQQRTETKLEETNRELDAFSYSVAHDLRAPLQHLLIYSQLLQEEYQQLFDEDGKMYLNRISRSIQTMNTMIDNLLMLSQATQKPVEKHSVNLTGLLQEISEELKNSQPGRDAQIIIVDAMNIQADPELLKIMITNLFQNAWKYTSKQAQTRIEWGTLLPDQEPQHKNDPVFYVKDNGAGFDMQHKNKLFGTFQRLHTKSEFPGTGIGLATVQRIVKRHGGRIWAESSVNQGATFFFSFPTSNEP
ncbi:MAG: response regulator [SAR324 cluster bacterium]|nr:response regulator [SAR324 cluster bacterium]